MKKYIGLFVVLVVALSVGATVKAEDNASSNIPVPVKTIDGKRVYPVEGGENEMRGAVMGNPDMVRKEMEMKREKMQEEIKMIRDASVEKMKSLREEIKKEKDAMKKKTKEARVAGREQALERFTVAVERMNSLKDRVNENIVKFEVKGVDVTDAKKFVATIETKLSEVKAKVVEANTLLSTSIEQLTKEQKTKLRTLAQEAQTLMKEAHQALNAAIKSLKDNMKEKMEMERESKAKEDTN